jgi:hypothetical protein
MCYTNKLNYPKDWTFSIKELSPVTPEMIYAYIMAFKTFGREDPTPSNNPTKEMASTILAIKKKVSNIMVNCIPSWDVLHNSGNPSKSAVVNDLISFVKKKATRKQGKKSGSDHTFEHSKFKQVLKNFHHSIEANLNRMCRYPVMLKFMLYFVACGYDAAHLYKSSLLVPSFQYPWALTCILRWCKNVRENREYPNQIILGVITLIIV